MCGSVGVVSGHSKPSFTIKGHIGNVDMRDGGTL